MHDSHSDSSKELELILATAGKLVSRGIEPARFLEWFQTDVPKIAPHFAEAMVNADGGGSQLIYGMARALWNAMPQPSNRYRPRPLPAPNRNGRCPCGSGRKYKQCCLQVEPPRELFESMNLLRYVLDAQSKAGLKRLDTRAMDPAALDDVARQWAHEGKFERSVALLEPLFEAGKKPPKHAELLLDTLFDVWPPNHTPQRRRRFAERLAKEVNPEVACVALHRCIVMLADEGNMEEAWSRFHTGLRQFPTDVNFAGLEITLLLRENRRDEAKRRAEFWAHKLRRQGSEFHAYADRLLSMVESNDDNNELEQLRSESPIVDLVAGLIESPPISTEGYAPRPIDFEEPIVLAPKPALTKSERRWFEVVGDSSQSMDLLDSGDEPVSVEQFVAMLEQDQTLLHSFSVLDDIAASLYTMTETWPEFGALLELVLHRGESMLFSIVTGREARQWVIAEDWHESLPEIVHDLPWVFSENRQALRLLARHVDHLNFTNLAGAECWLPRARALLRLNPDDNHGYRDLVSSELLRQRLPMDALAVVEEYPDDAMGALHMNRVLSLFLLKREEAAALYLRDGAVRLRELRKAITQERYAKPRGAEDFSFTIGGRDEAWFYRREMRATWKEVGAIEWLRQQPVPRKSGQKTTRLAKAHGSLTENLEEDFKAISGLQVFKKYANGHTGATKNRCTVENLWIFMENLPINA